MQHPQIAFICVGTIRFASNRDSRGAMKEADNDGAGKSDAKFHEGSEWRALIILTLCSRQGNQPWEDGETAGVGDPEASLTASWVRSEEPKEGRAASAAAEGKPSGAASSGVNALGAALNVELEWFIGGAKRRTQKRRRVAGRQSWLLEGWTWEHVPDNMGTSMGGQSMIFSADG
ncbi:hypothetical protein B0H14DRAFT_2621760 [Mycena olivaceomarginata]|nr:hypothetical protein B0H14DRAFT_2621760 [Mycena olivaceomarginata]